LDLSPVDDLHCDFVTGDGVRCDWEEVRAVVSHQGRDSRDTIKQRGGILTFDFAETANT
jgi:hypothetical protein